ncbi:Ribosomal protein S12 methylthiotransferase [Frankliniella fusca]|uniref:Ribosomal protein S12 methylthiotransferase n=1 Tax=Frankliniella fusca TaxID=407009 RepID=A0AAE1I3C3_9NEOP|nr:Ribosomal protein S12 methylthiotransferase [Frankliniella fusca]
MITLHNGLEVKMTVNEAQRASKWNSDQHLPEPIASEIDRNSSRCNILSSSESDRVTVTAPFQPQVTFFNDRTPEEGLSEAIYSGQKTVRKNLFPGYVDYGDTELLSITPLQPVPFNDISVTKHQSLVPLQDMQPVENANVTLEALFPVLEIQHSQCLQDDIGVVNEEEAVRTLQATEVVASSVDDFQTQFQNENVNNDNLESIFETHTQHAEVSSTKTKTKRSRRSEPSAATPPKKRQRRPQSTKAVLAKLAYNSGAAHISLRGKERKAREMKNGCTESCRRKCQGKITEADRQKLFRVYYGSKNKHAQWHMLSKLVHKVPVARRTVQTNSPSRKFSYTYQLTDKDGKAVMVCQKMFLDTFDISIRVVHSAMNKNSPDKRGTHDTRKRTPPIIIRSVKDHIKSFPVIESHYCRENTRRRYLQHNLSISKMHRLYVMKHGEGENTASLRQYMVNQDLKKQYDKHQQAKTTVRRIRQEVKEFSKSEQNSDGKVKVVCFDLQKVFFCPKSDVGEFFYKRKLSCYNFTVYDCTKKEATCFVWDQTIGGRGAIEVSSCVYEFIKQEVQKGVKEFFIFSDSCWAQNKNKILFTMYSVASQKFNIKITHRYLEKGHTQMECDSVHALIERKTRNQDIYTPMQWYGHILSAKVKKPSYTVFRVQQEHLLSFKELASGSFKWDKVPISKVCEIVLDCEAPGKVCYKRNFDDPDTVFDVFLKKPGRPYNWLTFSPPRAYDRLLQLKPKLVEDLKYFLKHNLIPENSRAYYEHITSYGHGVTIAEAGCEDDNDLPEEITENDDELHAKLDQYEDADDPPEVDVADQDSDVESICSDNLD